MKRPKLFALAALVLGLLFAACGGSSAPNPTPTTLPPTDVANESAGASACATENHAPFDSFRSDPVSKLTASTKPKLIEFWAVW